MATRAKVDTQAEARRALANMRAERDAALAREEALAEVLGVINRSPGNPGPVFDLILAKAMRLCGGAFGMLYTGGRDRMRLVAQRGLPVPLAAHWQQGHVIAELPPVLRAAVEARSVRQILDQRDSEAYRRGLPEARAMVELGGARSVLIVPLSKDAAVVGHIAIYRQEVRAFSDTEVALLETFAAQAVLAMQNARLFGALQERTVDLTRSLAELHRAQERLVQSEKMASLGQLTAGIAHEIKNPLNFVNNFSALSAELVDELRELLAPEPLGETARAEVADLTALLKGNLEKAMQHGKRADGIVKNMLLYSREGGGEMRRVDLNATVDEALNLAYHGARAEKPGFNISLIRNYDPAAGELELYSQEFTRVLLNLFSNGFYAATRRKAELGDARFEPTLTVSTEAGSGEIRVRVRDNGIGIPDAVKAKMFEPFFTTKPAGEGTGLGLSLSHDIVVKQHGGTIAVESREGEFTEFSVILPRART